MIFKQFNPNQDIVAGRTTRVASGYWPNGLTNWSQSFFVDDYWSLTGSSTPSPSYGTSYYDVRRTMYYLNVYPALSYRNNSDPYFSIAYGHIAGDVGSGSFSGESASIQTSPTKAIYTQYRNMLLGTSDLDGKFTMTYGTSTTASNDIWVIDFSAYKMKDRVDEGLLEFTLSGSNGQFTFFDDSPYTSQNQTVYQIVMYPSESNYRLDNLPPTASYEGIGLFYPQNGVVVLNAGLVAQRVGLTANGIGGVDDGGPVTSTGYWSYNPGLDPGTWNGGATYNHRTLFVSMWLAALPMKVRKSEYVPARHYFVRVMNREFNYSNNPTYVYDGTDGVNPKGTIYNTDFVNDPKTYITTVGLYNDTNELVAVAKLSRPYVKSFDQELLIKVRLDF
jgi:hypothetical protein